MITRKQFDILVNLIDRRVTSQREVANLAGISLGTANKVLKELCALGLTDGFNVTAAGIKELQPFKVKRAIFLAAGFGSRLVPVTLNTPKPLVKVKGKRIIDTLLDAVVAAGIEEIIIVRGYLGEQFDQLLTKYPGVKFVDNVLFNEANNISSALVVRDKLSGAYVLESDLLLHNPSIIRKYEYSSNFLGFKVDRTDDWCLKCDANGLITEEKIGGEDCHQMVGISYWDEKDGKKLKKDIEDVYNQPGGKERYWEQVVFVYKKDNYKVNVRECNREDVIEIDTFNELKALDKSYDV